MTFSFGNSLINVLFPSGNNTSNRSAWNPSSRFVVSILLKLQILFPVFFPQMKPMLQLLAEWSWPPVQVCWVGWISRLLAFMDRNCASKMEIIRSGLISARASALNAGKGRCRSTGNKKLNYPQESQRSGPFNQRPSFGTKKISLTSSRTQHSPLHNSFFDGFDLLSAGRVWSNQRNWFGASKARSIMAPHEWAACSFFNV